MVRLFDTVNAMAPPSTDVDGVFTIFADSPQPQGFCARSPCCAGPSGSQRKTSSSLQLIPRFLTFD
jgi:hypothetical protein